MKTFDSANCASNSLSPKMFDEYENQYNKNSNKPNSNLIEKTIDLHGYSLESANIKIKEFNPDMGIQFFPLNLKGELIL